LRGQIDRIWNDFWWRLANPLQVIEQITFLTGFRRLPRAAASPRISSPVHGLRQQRRGVRARRCGAPHRGAARARAAERRVSSGCCSARCSLSSCEAILGMTPWVKLRSDAGSGSRPPHLERTLLDHQCR
jgi:hypothetical protein